MGILEKLNLLNKTINKSSVLLNWDSRESCSIDELNTTDVKIVQNFIEFYDKYTTYKNCFLNNVFLSEIAVCFGKKKEYINCEFEITNLLNCANFLVGCEFKNCTFYISDYDRNTVSFNIHTTLKNKLYSNDNIVYKKSYIEYLSDKYKFNLNKVPKYLLKGISINYTDLSKCILPSDRNFFSNLSDTEIHNVKLPTLDLNKYDINRVRFSNIAFTEDSILSKDAMKTGIFSCLLPIIDFEEVVKEYDGFIRFYNCTFRENTIFPKDKDFFTRCTIRNCVMPTFDYSDYKIVGDSFYRCSFTEESKLPNEFFTSKYIKNIEQLVNVPTSYLEKIIILTELEKPKAFYEKYLNVLSENDKFLFYKKYKLS